MAVIMTNGDLYTWGNNNNGQLGINNTTDKYVPTKIMSNIVYAEICSHSAAIDKSGNLYMWGSNNDGQTALGTNYRRLTPGKIEDNVKGVSIASGSSAYIKQDSSLYVLGRQIGTTRSGPTPQKILDNIKIINIVNNNGSIGIAISNSGTLYTWGSSSYLGSGVTTSTSPRQILANAYQSYSDGRTTAVVTLDNGILDGGLYTFGYGIDGLIGNGTNSNYNTPYKITIKSTSTSATVKATTKLTKTYTDLEPDETYNFYVLKATKAENLLDSENLYYIAQETADSDGKLTVTYAPTENYETAHRFVVAMHRTDLSYATVVADTLTYNAEEQYIKPSVKLDGVYLVEGVDYELTGEYSATEPGEYTAMINGIGRYTGKVDFTYTMIPDFVNLSTLDKTQLYLGNTITITASAAGGEGAYTYSYYFRNTEDLYWIPLKTNTAETVIEFEPEEIGKYYARIDVKDEDGKVKRKAIVFTVNSRNLANQSFVSSESVKVGDTVTLYGDAMGGTKPYNYAYYIKDMFDDTWTLLKTYSATDKFDVTFAKEGTYDVCIRVKDLNSTIAKKYFLIDVEPKKVLPLTNTSTLLSENVKLGGTIDIKASAIGGNGNYQYAAYYKKANDTKWITKQGFKDNTDISIKPAYAALYNVCVKVQDESGTIEKQYFEVNVISDKLENTSTISTDTITLGEKVCVQGSATGGTGSYQYQVVYKQTSQSKWTTAQAFSENATVAFKPANATTYDVCAKVKDSNGTIIKKFFTVQVKAKLTNTSAVSATTIKKGSTVTVNGSATGGTGNYTYAVFYKQKAQTKWTTKQDFYENADVSIKPAQATDYDICIKVKDKDGTIAKQYFTITVTE